MTGWFREFTGACPSGVFTLTNKSSQNDMQMREDRNGSFIRACAAKRREIVGWRLKHFSRKQLWHIIIQIAEHLIARYVFQNPLLWLA